MCRANVNAAAVLAFLHSVLDVFKHYFSELEEESLRDNFVIAYELLDEVQCSRQCSAYLHPTHFCYQLQCMLPQMLHEYWQEGLCASLVAWSSMPDSSINLLQPLQVMDFGYPQFTEAKILSEFIKTDAYKMEVQARPPMAVTNAVSWRSEGIKYKKNEVHCTRLMDTAALMSYWLHCITGSRAHAPRRGVKSLKAACRMLWQVFLDVVESVNLLVNSNGTVVRSEVVGALKMRTYLSGMPECKLGLNDKVGQALHCCSDRLTCSSLHLDIHSLPAGL